MASTDARPIPIKNTAYRVTFPLLDADGDLVTGASGLDSEISKDAGTFADCTNEATEIATSSGMYYLDLTSTEMNADCVAIIIKTSTSGAKTVPIVLYPQESGDIKVDVQSFGGTAGTFASGRAEVNMTHIAGSSVSTSSAQLGVNVVNAGGTAWGSGAITAASIATDAITAAKIAADAIGASELAADAVTEIATGVWAATTRLLTAGTNIVLAKGTGVTGFNDLDGAGVRSGVGLASANLDTQLSGINSKTTNLPSDPADQSLIIAATDAIMTAVGDVPTNAELATALAGSDDAVLAVLGTPVVTIAADIANISAGSGPTASEIADEVQTRTLDANIVKVNSVTVNGTGSPGNEWGP